MIRAEGIGVGMVLGGLAALLGARCVRQCRRRPTESQCGYDSGSNSPEAGDDVSPSDSVSPGPSQRARFLDSGCTAVPQRGGEAVPLSAAAAKRRRILRRRSTATSRGSSFSRGSESGVAAGGIGDSQETPFFVPTTDSDFRMGGPELEADDGYCEDSEGCEEDEEEEDEEDEEEEEEDEAGGPGVAEKTRHDEAASALEDAFLGAVLRQEIP